MAAPFDPHYQWLGIRPDERPYSLYRLLGVADFEDNPDVLDRAAERQMNHLRQFQAGVNGLASQQLLNEVASARIVLLDPARRADYDRQWRQQVAARAPRPDPAAGSTPVRAIPQAAPLAIPQAAPVARPMARPVAQAYHQAPPAAAPAPPTAAPEPNPFAGISTGAAATSKPAAHAAPRRKASGAWIALAAVGGTAAAGLAIVLVLLLAGGGSKAGGGGGLLGPSVGKLTVAGRKDALRNVTFLLDGQPAPLSSTPRDCPPGKHLVIASRWGYADQRHEMQVAAGKTAAVELGDWRPKTKLQLHWHQVDRDLGRAVARILQNGAEVPREKLPLAGTENTVREEFALEPGLYEVALDRAKFEPFRATIDTRTQTIIGLWPRFFPKDTDGAGLVAEVYEGRDFNAKKRQDIRSQIYERLTTDSFWPGVPEDEFSIRWHGYLKAARPGRYRLKAYVDDSLRINLKDSPAAPDKWVIDAWGAASEQSAEVTLNGAPQPIVVEFAEWGVTQELRLLWAPADVPGAPLVPIPPEAFFHKLSAAEQARGGEHPSFMADATQSTVPGVQQPTTPPSPPMPRLGMPGKPAPPPAAELAPLREKTSLAFGLANLGDDPPYGKVAELLQAADRATTPPGDRYAQLTLALELSARTNGEQAAAALAALGRSFELDLHPLREASWRAAQSNADLVDPRRCGDYVFGAEALWRSACRDGQFDLASEILRNVRTTCAGNHPMLLRVRKRCDLLQEEQAQYEAADAKYRMAREALSADANNAAAQAAAGRFLCLVRGDWSAGAPLLTPETAGDLKFVLELEQKLPTAVGSDALRLCRLHLDSAAPYDPAKPRSADAQEAALRRIFWSTFTERAEHWRQRSSDAWATQPAPDRQATEAQLARVQETRPYLPTGGWLAGRDPLARRAFVKREGNDLEAEWAADQALAWIVRHRMPDGGWSFDHAAAPGCDAQCAHGGKLTQARNGATALALLALMAAGSTPTDGPYRMQVAEGLKFLLDRADKKVPAAANWREEGGTMYSHALATTALCEAAASTKNAQYRLAAINGLNFIVTAQDPLGGGWRYEPRQRGDTSATGWQVSALLAGRGAGLLAENAISKALGGASKFLDGVQTNGGVDYGYELPGQGSQATTAAGIYCRQALNWDRPLVFDKAVAQIERLGPHGENVYHNYYATRVLARAGDAQRRAWMARMRQALLATQQRQGHPRGSWYFGGETSFNDTGGRLFNTALATLILQTPYRYAD